MRLSGGDGVKEGGKSYLPAGPGSNTVDDKAVLRATVEKRTRVFLISDMHAINGQGQPCRILTHHDDRHDHLVPRGVGCRGQFLQ